MICSIQDQHALRGELVGPFVHNLGGAASAVGPEVEHQDRRGAQLAVADEGAVSQVDYRRRRGLADLLSSVGIVAW